MNLIGLVAIVYEMIIANSTLRASLPIYHLISNARSWNIFIIQQIVTLSKYGHDALDICHPAVYVASYVGRKSEVRKCRQRDLKMLGCFCYQFVE